MPLLVGGNLVSSFQVRALKLQRLHCELQGHRHLYEQQLAALAAHNTLHPANASDAAELLRHFTAYSTAVPPSIWLYGNG